MALGGCYACIKYLMFAFNFVYWLSGCAILGVGIWLRVDENAAEFLQKSPRLDILHTLAYVLIAIGFVIMIIGFLGCCGAVRESQCMLIAFFVLLFLIFASLLGFGIFAVVAKETASGFTSLMLKEGIENYEKDKAFMNSVQNYFHCCGNEEGITDYPLQFKLTACEIATFDEPCHGKINEWVSNRLVIIAGISIGFAVKMILGMVFSMLLCCAIRDQSA